MNNSSRSDRAFEALRQAPVEIPLAKVEQFVIASAATGAFSMSLASKLAIKFHLNSIIAMTSAFTAAAVAGIVFLASSGHASKAETKAPVFHEQKTTSPVLSERPSEEPLTNVALPVDSPEVKTAEKTISNITVHYTDGDSTVIKPGNSSVWVSSGSGNSGSTVVVDSPDSSEGKVSAYSYSYSGESRGHGMSMTIATPAAVPEMPAVYIASSSGSEVSPVCVAVGNGNCTVSTGSNSVARCCGDDSLIRVIQNSLVQDGLIGDVKHFTFEFTGKKLVVDGKEQDKETWKKYKELIEKNSEYRINKHFEFVITMNRNSQSIRIDVDD